MECHTKRCAHKSPRTRSSFSSTDLFSASTSREASNDPVRQYNGCLLYKPPRRDMLRIPTQESLRSPFMGICSWGVLEGRASARSRQHCSQAPVQRRAQARIVMDAGPNDNAGTAFMVPPSGKRHVVASSGPSLPSKLREVQATRLAPRWNDSRSLGEAVVTTLHAAKAPSTRRLYALRWDRFSRWCQLKDTDPVQCETEPILRFLQSLLESGLTKSTLRGYVPVRLWTFFSGF